MADPAIPATCLYHAEHDWARGGRCHRHVGITWYAQDALREVVFFEPPEVGAQDSKDQPYTEVESVKAVSDVFAAAVGRGLEVNQALATSRRRSTRTRTVRGGSSR